MLSIGAGVSTASQTGTLVYYLVITYLVLVHVIARRTRPAAGVCP